MPSSHGVADLPASLPRERSDGDAVPPAGPAPAPDPNPAASPASGPPGAPVVRTRSQRQRRRRILQAAAALASRGGVEAMQMRTVAERAGVALGTLYRYFPSKMDLVVAVVSEEIDLLEASIERRPPGAATPAGRAVDVLMRATRGLMREPELADALIRSLVMSEVEAPFGDRMAGLLLRVAGGGLMVENASEEQFGLASSLSGVWVQELLEMLHGRRTYDQIQRRIELAASRLLADF
ncbi:helix-turn-helix transcriptional regulator [Microbispora sp. RL4-1S]|uniref:Helix-turn-helix transcriptional regulator n=1 Tax=Microbispora oryzae TaxID=2806554 RepID=A0A941AIQ1_9ACTN|nr:TetR family transcriptional regulator [Microbispora oryzae]MBP2703363.1 helix-turn-helix transcriptional regulator [Microbispora oryzae]